MFTDFVEKVNNAHEERAVAPADPLSIDPEIRPASLEALGLSEAPTELHFVRSHFGVPPVDPVTWRVELGGSVRRPLRLSLADLRRRPRIMQTVVLECAGHRRNEFDPGTSGLQWGAGAVSEARWTGAPLAGMLAEAAPSGAACEVVFEGADRGPHAAARSAVPFARSIPLAWASEVLLAWEMNGAPIPPKHGGPVRAIVPGCYGVDSVKWLRRIEVLEHPFAGPFQVSDYRLLGREGLGSRGPLHRLPVSALIVEPASGSVVPAGPLEVFGVAWGGRGGVAGVDVRLGTDDWTPAAVARPKEQYAFVRWSALLEPRRGAQTIEIRARDRAGNVQPDAPAWNAGGYGNNSVHRITVTVTRGYGRGIPATDAEPNTLGGDGVTPQ
jgi:DMSO/TMAO reductase YedYZ molybdopterin-dependent catalytic subunit